MSGEQARTTRAGVGAEGGLTPTKKPVRGRSDRTVQAAEKDKQVDRDAMGTSKGVRQEPSGRL